MTPAERNSRRALKIEEFGKRRKIVRKNNKFLKTNFYSYWHKELQK
jgi:hypothetical protein